MNSDFSPLQKPGKMQEDPVSSQVIAIHLKTLHADVGEMKSVLRELTSAITKLALIEQQQTQTLRAQERFAIMLDKLDNRIMDVERRMPEISRTSTWVDRGIWAAAATVAIFIAKQTGLF
jgi:hypothetical protein